MSDEEDGESAIERRERENGTKSDGDWVASCGFWINLTSNDQKFCFYYPLSKLGIERHE